MKCDCPYCREWSVRAEPEPELDEDLLARAVLLLNLTGGNLDVLSDAELHAVAKAIGPIEAVAVVVAW